MEVIQLRAGKEWYVGVWPGRMKQRSRAVTSAKSGGLWVGNLQKRKCVRNELCYNDVFFEQLSYVFGIQCGFSMIGF